MHFPPRLLYSPSLLFLPKVKTQKSQTHTNSTTTAAKNPSHTLHPTPVLSAIRSILLIVPFSLTLVPSKVLFMLSASVELSRISSPMAIVSCLSWLTLEERRDVAVVSFWDSRDSRTECAYWPLRKAKGVSEREGGRRWRREGKRSTGSWASRVCSCLAVGGCCHWGWSWSWGAERGSRRRGRIAAGAGWRSSMDFWGWVLATEMGLQGWRDSLGVIVVSARTWKTLWVVQKRCRIPWQFSSSQ